MKEKPADEPKLQIHLDEETAQGVYANLAVVNHSDAEFTLDFIFVPPQAPKAKVRSRVILSPRHLKRLIGALQENLRRYEQLYGPVSAAPVPQAEETRYH